MEIKEGEWVRTKNGIIGTLIEISKAGNGTRYAGEYITDTIISIYTKPHTEVRVKDKEVKSHSNNIIDLIEVGDIIVEMKAKIPRIIRINNIEMLDRFRNGDKIYSIVTFEQFSSLEYII